MEVEVEVEGIILSTALGIQAGVGYLVLLAAADNPAPPPTYSLLYQVRSESRDPDPAWISIFDSAPAGGLGGKV